MKEGWEYKKLADVALYSIGLTYKPSDVSEEGTIVLRSSNIQNDKLDLNDIVKVNCPIKESLYVQKDDILMCSRNGSSKLVGKVALIPEIEERMTYGTFMMVIRSVYNPYLFYYFKSDNFRSQIKHGEANMINQITRYMLDDVYLYIPPLSEQQSIVDYLDSAFAKIDAMKANAEKALNEANAFFQASLKEMLEPKEGTKWSSIGDLFETYSGGTPTKSNKEYYEGGSIPWLRSGEVCQKEITRTEMFITEKGLKESSAKYYPENTVVVAMYGATAAQVGILRIKATSNQAVCGILPHKDFLPEFVYYWFSSIEDMLAAQAQGGAQPNISQQKIKKVEIPIYSIAEQQSIVATLDSLKSKLDRLQENYNKISQECDALKQAILRQVFE